jgi:hypothetical protein
MSLSFRCIVLVAVALNHNKMDFTPMSDAEYAALTDICFDEVVPEHIVDLMDHRMGFPQCNEPPAPRHHVVPSKLDLNLHFPQDLPELVAMAALPAVDDVQSLVRTAFRYSITVERSFNSFTAFRYQRWQVRDVIASWVQRVVHAVDVVFLFNMVENEKVLKIIQNTWKLYADLFKLEAAATRIDAVFHTVTEKLVDSLFEWIDVDPTFEETRRLQLVEVTRKGRTSFLARH